MVSVRAPPCLLLSVFVVSCLCRVVSSLYFHITHSEVKCFTVEIPEATLLLGNFGTRVYDAQRNTHLSAPQDLSVQLEVKGPDDKLVLSQASSSEGNFTFTSHEAGVHHICLRPSPMTSDPPPSAGGTLAIHLDVTVGGRTSTQVKGTEKLTELMLRVRQLTEMVQQIQREYNYQKIREKRFRAISHSTNMWIFWWPVVRSLYVVAIITWHTKSW